VTSAAPSSWTVDDADEATKRASDHHPELEYALLRIAAPHKAAFGAVLEVAFTGRRLGRLL
jgi:hypothetical protein